MKEEQTNNKYHLEHWQVVTLFLMGYDFLAVLAAYFGALWIRFDCRYQLIDAQYLIRYEHSILIYAVFCVILFYIANLYKSI